MASGTQCRKSKTHTAGAHRGFRRSPDLRREGKSSLNAGSVAQMLVANTINDSEAKEDRGSIPVRREETRRFQQHEARGLHPKRP